MIFNLQNFAVRALFFSLIVLCFSSSSAHAQKIAVLAPNENVQSRTFAENLADSLSANFKVLDFSLSRAAFSSAELKDPFNQTIEQAKNIGARIGSDHFILIKSDLLRRSSFQKDLYHEAYAATFVIDSRTGGLVFWKINSFEADNPEEAEKRLFESASSLAGEITQRLRETVENETRPKAEIIEVPDENSPEAKNFRPPLPYRRLKPEYTSLADSYGVEATVDILVDIGAGGEILRTRIVRWAGYGLDEAVEKTVREMNWRAADRDGKPLPVRVLLRYNFKDLKPDE